MIFEPSIIIAPPKIVLSMVLLILASASWGSDSLSSLSSALSILKTVLISTSRPPGVLIWSINCFFNLLRRYLLIFINFRLLDVFEHLAQYLFLALFIEKIGQHFLR